jgi:hypothetical protein
MHSERTNARSSITIPAAAEGGGGTEALGPPIPRTVPQKAEWLAVLVPIET